MKPPVTHGDQQPRSQGLSSLPPLLRKDPGSGWSCVSQNLGGLRNMCYGRGGNVGLVIIARRFDVVAR